MNSYKFTLAKHEVLRKEQHILPPESMKFKEKEFVSKEGESENKDYSERNVDNHQNKNSELSWEDIKQLTKIKWSNISNKHLSMRNDLNNSIKKFVNGTNMYKHY